MPHPNPPGPGRAPRGRRSLVAAGMSLLTAAVPTVTAVAVTTTAAHAAPAPQEPDTAALAGNLVNQTIAWQPCDFTGASTPDVVARLQAVPGLACADITVPRDWHNPQDGNTITLRISKTATSQGPDRQGIALVNPGGPGGSGLPWGAAMAVRAPELAKKYDFIGFDPRGVGHSTPLRCSIDIGEWVNSHSMNDLTKAIADGCRTLTPLAKYITTEQTGYDMDFIRVLLGQAQTSYYGYSYGTWLGAWYAATFPSKVRRMALDSSTDVAASSLQDTFNLQSYARDREFQNQFLPYLARHPDIFNLGTDPIKIRQAWEEVGGTRTFIGKLLVAWFLVPAFYHTDGLPAAGRIFAAILPLLQQLQAQWSAKANDPAAVAQTVRDVVAQLLARTDLTEADRAFLTTGRDGALDWLAKQTQAPTATSTFQYDPETSAFQTIRCSDGQWSQNLAYWDSWQSKLDRDAPFMAPFSRDYVFGTNAVAYPACAYWPTANQMPKPDPQTFPKILVLNDELDSATAYEGALDSVKHLPGAQMISVDNEGSHGVFPYHTTCVDDPVDAYFLSGTMPQDQYTVCPGKPLPGEDRTYDVDGGSIGRKGASTNKAVTDDMRVVDQWLRHLGPVIDPLFGTPV
jgi:pimeloyl-ACP methyl ester carboxylesterase